MQIRRSPLGERHLDVVARQQRSVRELKLKHLLLVHLVLVFWARRVSEDVIDATLFAWLWWDTRAKTTEYELTWSSRIPSWFYSSLLTPQRWASPFFALFVCSTFHKLSTKTWLRVVGPLWHHKSDCNLSSPDQLDFISFVYFQRSGDSEFLINWV